MPLQEAARLAGVRNRASYSLIRWATAGVLGGRLRLEAVQCTGRWETSVDAMKRFLRAREDGLRGRRAIDRKRQRELSAAELRGRGMSEARA